LSVPALLLYNSFAMLKRFLPLIVLAVLLTFPLSGEVSPARVGFVEGTAALSHAGEEEWLEAVLNLPVFEGDRLVLQEDSRVEVEFDEGSFLRLGPNTDLTIRRFTAEGLEIELMLGAVILRAASPGWTLHGGELTMAIGEPGLYRLDADEAGGVHFAVRRGAAEVSGVLSASLGGGQALSYEDPERHWISQTYVKDDLDFWSDRRDARTVARHSAAQLGGHYAGVHELDRHGDWGYHAPYGLVWWPHVGYGWGPFRTGRWVHFSRWGWTWVSHEPWGWLPFHRGHWAFVPSFGRWCWVPGRLTHWSPAAVHFFFGKGFVGWAPRTLGVHWAGGAGGAFGRGIGRTGFSLVREEDFARGVIPENRFVRPNSDLLAGLSPGSPVFRAGQGRGPAVQPPPALSSRPLGGRAGRVTTSPGDSSAGPNVIRIPGRTAETPRAGRTGSRIASPPGSVGVQSAPGISGPGRLGSRQAGPRFDRGGRAVQSDSPAAGPAMRSPSRGAPSSGTTVVGSRSGRGAAGGNPALRQGSPARTSPSGRDAGRIAVPRSSSGSGLSGGARMQNSRRTR
jgi:hypothetical protein